LQARADASSIYDLGYQHYGGARFGRRHIVFGLYIESLRGAFGLGRGLPQKVFSFALVGLAIIPALVMLSISAITAEQIDLWRYEDYYGLIQIILALFSAGLATEVVGRDLRNRVLPLYFSRSLRRDDYVLAKIGALVTAMLVISLVPQFFLFFGNAFAGTDTFGYIREEADTIAPIIVSGVLISFMLAMIGLAIASRTPRRAYATGATIAVFLVSTAVGNAILHASPETFARFAILLSVFDVMDGFTFWFFQAGRTDTTRLADLPGALYALVALVVVAVCTVLVFRRYEKLAL
jgi:ABC-2 type transport system permease protein